ncbi:MAG: DEAD/DEAH box helicase family protein [Flavobacteriales bacterium]|nr:DEAD/DEAH box helicase family protein [Flavobacteriales bacterium]
MELKPYQQRVLEDLDQFVLKRTYLGDAASTFNAFWRERIGAYNPLADTGMRPYQDNVPGVPHLCIKVPTAGGKTFIAVNALHTIYNNAPAGVPRVVLWLVPWSNLLQQTVRNLSDPDHPYRQRLNLLFQHRVAVLEKDALLQGTSFNPVAVSDQLTIIVMSFASLRAKRKEDRKVFQQNGQLGQWADVFEDDVHQLKDYEPTAAINVIRHLTPVVVVDESHNAESVLSVDMLKDLNPSFILDLTATPKENSNIISMVPALELKKEHMVKLPVIVHNLHDKTEVVQNALDLQAKLEALAKEQEKAGGRYIRPIVLFQAQPRTGGDNTTFEKLKAQLLKAGIRESHIKIKTADKDELKGVDLLDPKCPVRYIITVNALKEGWDCPFAYILASLADKSSAVDVEQILGRVLRLPYVTNHAHDLLNMSYVLTASNKFMATCQSVVQALQQSGFSAEDYRGEDLSQSPPNLPAGEQGTLALEDETDDIDPARVSYDPEGNATPAPGSKVEAIAEAARTKSAEMEAAMAAETSEGQDPIVTAMPGKVKTYPMRAEHAAAARKLKLPQFMVKVPGSLFTGEGESWQKLNQELLLEGFDLAKEDTKIDFDAVDPELATIDVAGAGKNPLEIKRITAAMLGDPQVQYILGRPHENQVADVAHLLMRLVGGVPPIADPLLVAYIQRVMADWDGGRISDALNNRHRYAALIKHKVRGLADRHAEEQFKNKLQLGTISTQPAWAFPKHLLPGDTAPPIARSLYETEGSMGEFEAKVVAQLSALPNIAWWHRNLTRGKGFALNGFKNNHYPDFILCTTAGKIVLVESKGDDRDNSDSEAKARLGRQWQDQSGTGFRYFMVFDRLQVEGAYTLAEAKKLIGSL